MSNILNMSQSVLELILRIYWSLVRFLMAFLPLIFQIILYLMGRSVKTNFHLRAFLKIWSTPCFNYFCAEPLYKVELLHKCLMARCKWYLLTTDSINKGKMATEGFFLFSCELLQFNLIFVSHYNSVWTVQKCKDPNSFCYCCTNIEK